MVGLTRLQARIVEHHADLAMKDLQQGAVPILHDVMMRGKSRVDKLTEVFSDGLPSMPVGDAEIANGVLGEAIEAFAKGLVIDFLPHRQRAIPAARFS